MPQPPQIAALEQVYNIKLKEIDDDENVMLYDNKNTYQLNKEGAIIGLNLDENEISDINALKDFTQLHRLTLYHNQISDINALKNLTQLQELYLWNNQIGDINALKNLTQLQELNLGSNQINNISVLKNLTQLKKLDLDSNQISDIQPILPLFQNTSFSFYLGNNRLEDGLLQILNSDSIENRYNELVAYYNRQNVSGTQKLKVVKLILIGNTGAGKTTLSDNFTGNNLAAKGSTHGINFFQLTSNNVAINGYDFGGQDYYHNTHFTFFDENAFYVLVWGNEQEDAIALNKEGELLFPLNYWLGSVLSISKSALWNTFLEQTDFYNITQKIADSTNNGILDVPFEITSADNDKKITNKDLQQLDFAAIAKLLQTKGFSKRSKISYKQLLKNIANFNTDEIPNNEFFTQLRNNIAHFKENKHSFNFYVTQNINGDKKYLDEAKLKREYGYITDFLSACFHHTIDKDAIKKTLLDKIEHFAKDVEVNRLDYSVGQSFKTLANNGKVILTLQEIKALDTLKQHTDKIDVMSLIKTLHRILVCYYLELSDTTKSYFDAAVLKKINNKVIIDIKTFTEWVYVILNKNELKDNQYGYFSKQDAIKWLGKIKQAEEHIDYLLAFMLEHKIIFKVENAKDRYFAPNYLRDKLSRTEQLFLNTFEKPLVQYKFTAFFHTSLLVDILQAFYHQLLVEDERKWEYVLWKNKVILFDNEAQNKNSLVYIQFDIQPNAIPLIKISRFNKEDVSDAFILKILEFIEKKIIDLDYTKEVITPKQDYIPFSCLELINTTEDKQATNLVFYDNTVYRRADFRLFLKDKNNMPMKKIFISYSKFDEDYKEEFKKHTRTLQEQGIIDKPFDCGAIDLGAEWDETIQKAIDDCDFMVCLVSVDFLNTDYIRKYEVKKAIEKGKTLIPIIIKPCDWEKSDFGKFQASLRGKNISLNWEKSLKNIIKENTDIEKAAFWTAVIKEFREKLFPDMKP